RLSELPLCICSQVLHGLICIACTEIAEQFRDNTAKHSIHLLRRPDPYTEILGINITIITNSLYFNSKCSGSIRGPVNQTCLVINKHTRRCVCQQVIGYSSSLTY